MTQIIKESSSYLETQSASFNKKISEIEDKMNFNKKQLDETRMEKYNIDQQIQEIKGKVKLAKAHPAASSGACSRLRIVCMKHIHRITRLLCRA